MRALAVVLVLAACGKKHDEPAPKPTRPEVAFDRARCDQQLARLGQLKSPVERVKALVDACPVCGDWKPVFEWDTPRSEGGPTRDAILERMAACDAWCTSKAKDFFTATLDETRGTGQRKPWKQLADQCKAKVSAVPDGRYSSPTYFALDRIGRTLGTAPLATVTIQLPPTSMTGAPIEVATTTAPAAPVADTAPLVTVLGDTLYLATPQLAHLTSDGVQLVAGAYPPYPGKAMTADDWKALKEAVVIAPKGMPAKKLLELLAAVPDPVALHLAVHAKIELPGWPAIEMIDLDRKARADDKATVQDLLAPPKP